MWKVKVCRSIYNFVTIRHVVLHLVCLGFDFGWPPIYGNNIAFIFFPTRSHFFPFQKVIHYKQLPKNHSARHVNKKIDGNMTWEILFFTYLKKKKEVKWLSDVEYHVRKICKHWPEHTGSCHTHTTIRSHVNVKHAAQHVESTTHFDSYRYVAMSHNVDKQTEANKRIIVAHGSLRRSR